MNGHQKHKKIPRVNFGKFSRSEISFIGAPCGEIEDLCKKVARHSQLNCLYIDAKHGETLPLPDIHVLEYQQDHWHLTLNDHQNDPYVWRRLTEEYDLCLINGNHFKAEQQIICLHPKKYDSLKRKKNKLTRPIAMIDFTSEGIIPGELKEFLKDFEDLPVFKKEDIHQITDCLWTSCQNSKRLRGVVLTGGKSTRMGENKSKIRYHNKEQWQFNKELLEEYCHEVLLSVSDGFKIERNDTKFISDRVNNLGPFGGLMSCFLQYPNDALLVLAVDLPFVNEKTIKTLLEHRNPYKTATAFVNPENGFPEPLIAIWEPKSYARLLSFLSMGYTCPRKVLINSDIATAPLLNKNWIRNANTPEERDQVLKDLG